MSVQLEFVELREGLPFGVKVFGATRENLESEETQGAVKQAFAEKGLLVFEDVEQSPQMQLAISATLGPLKDHPVAAVQRADDDLAPGIIDIANDLADQVLVEVGGAPLASWLPWHFDHAYNNELNRAGVLRPIIIAPEGGMTGFADGVDLYNRLPADLQARIEGKNVIYHLGTLVINMRFGRPPSLRAIKDSRQGINVAEEAKKVPRAIHPAVWTRDTGEKILHVSLLHAVGIEGHEDPAGEALLEEVCRYINDNPKSYFHQWKLGQMLTWDNWRILHAVSGCDPSFPRRMHRTTIAGDYGLGHFEHGARKDSHMDVMM
jgi:taurine dioxygenase